MTPLGLWTGLVLSSQANEKLEDRIQTVLLSFLLGFLLESTILLEKYAKKICLLVCRDNFMTQIVKT
jgi:hypothetical protein